MSYRVLAAERDGRWVAHAEGSGRRWGIECGGATEREAVDRMTTWLAWQREHTGALEALQIAERAYHRLVAGSAFTSLFEAPLPGEMRKESLAAIEAARGRLDEVRARRPE